ncbi:hypothetical protein TNCV_3318961 [Trichonephila clavipes]|nr:hypothetical protein TNCV_3318961 [Trichonephila clavipes]
MRSFAARHYNVNRRLMLTHFLLNLFNDHRLSHQRHLSWHLLKDLALSGLAVLDALQDLFMRSLRIFLDIFSTALRNGENIRVFVCVFAIYESGTLAADMTFNLSQRCSAGASVDCEEASLRPK